MAFHSVSIIFKRTVLVGALALVGLTTAACDNDTGSPGMRAPEPSSEGPTPTMVLKSGPAYTEVLPSDQVILAALMAPQDLETGWVTIDVTSNPEPTSLCGLSVRAVVPEAATISAHSTTLRREADGLEIQHDVVAVAGADADAAFTELRGRHQRCTHEFEDGSTIRFELAEANFGDEAFAGTLAHTKDGQRLYPDAIFVMTRTGTVLSSVIVYPPTFDTSEPVDRYAAIATLKAQTLLAEFA